MKVMLTIKEINKEYGIPINFLYKLINEYKIPSYRYQNKTRYVKRKDIEEWISSRQIKEKILLKSKFYINE